MQKATMIHRTVVACPTCNLDDYHVLRRIPAVADGHIENHCLCRRCSSQFVYVEDRLGRPVRR
jgi:hypothetical protein